MVRRILRISGACLLWGVVVSILWVLVLRLVPPPVTWAMAAQAHEQGSVTRQWVPLEHIARAMPLAVVASEDQKFFDHFGFDQQAMMQAMRYNDRKQGRKVKGASTISQQTAKNVFCWPGRTFLRKGVEAWFTLLMEVFWSKQRILEMYLNVAETGKGRFGVAATSMACFHHAPDRLSPSEAALIAAVLPAPRRFNACAPSGYVLRRQAWILGQMNNLGDLFDPVVRERAREEIERREQREEHRKARRKHRE